MEEKLEVSQGAVWKISRGVNGRRDFWYAGQPEDAQGGRRARRGQGIGAGFKHNGEQEMAEEKAEVERISNGRAHWPREESFWAEPNPI